MHLCEYLFKSGHHVTGVDSLTSYYSKDLKKSRENILLENFGIKTNRLDVTNFDKTYKLINKENPDVVINLAAQAGVRLPHSEYEQYTKSNLLGHSNVVSASVICETPNILYASSSSVYGNLDQKSFSESEKGLSPLSFYGATKLSGEILSKSLIQNSNSRIRGLRFFTVYGTWGRPDMAYFRLIQCAITGREFNLFGDGTLTRDFTNISDVTVSISELLSNLASMKAGYSDVVNIGGGKPRSMKELIASVEKVAGKSIRVNLHPEAAGDVRKTVADFSYLRSLTSNWPKKTLEEGISEIYEWANLQEIRKKISDWN
jgi:UDP-glucuronate 4-epimerase